MQCPGRRWQGLLLRGNERPERGPRRHRLPFEVHRVAEYVVGLALVALPFSFGARIAPAGLAGVVMVALGATTRGRLGLLRWWSPRLHHVLDVAAVLLLAAMPLVPGTGGWLLAVFLEPTAAVFALLTLRTNYGPGAAGRGRATSQADGGAHTPRADGISAETRPEDRAARLGRLAAGLMGSVWTARRKDPR
ncbi:MAG: hypothetical protein QOD62_2128 [Actinomycetota bacterium]|jgi:hypothetical protein|nr:hypothetical protein [Actinomycetota bacterium]